MQIKVIIKQINFYHEMSYFEKFKWMKFYYSNENIWLKYYKKWKMIKKIHAYYLFQWGAQININILQVTQVSFFSIIFEYKLISIIDELAFHLCSFSFRFEFRSFS